jgi:DNA-binding GntR family transcriptional regulator
MEENKNFNKIEREILRVAFKERRLLTIKEIAEKVGVSWATARKYVLKLVKEGYLVKRNGS